MYTCKYTHWHVYIHVATCIRKSIASGYLSGCRTRTLQAIRPALNDFSKVRG